MMGLPKEAPIDRITVEGLADSQEGNSTLLRAQRRTYVDSRKSGESLHLLE